MARHYYAMVAGHPETAVDCETAGDAVAVAKGRAEDDSRDAGMAGDLQSCRQWEAWERDYDHDSHLILWSARWNVSEVDQPTSEAIAVWAPSPEAAAALYADQHSCSACGYYDDRESYDKAVAKGDAWLDLYVSDHAAVYATTCRATFRGWDIDGLDVADRESTAENEGLSR